MLHKEIPLRGRPGMAGTGIPAGSQYFAAVPCYAAAGCGPCTANNGIPAAFRPDDNSLSTRHFTRTILLCLQHHLNTSRDKTFCEICQRSGGM